MKPKSQLDASDSEAVIAVRGLRKRYGALEAVAGIDLEVKRGEVFAFLAQTRKGWPALPNRTSRR